MSVAHVDLFLHTYKTAAAEIAGHIDDAANLFMEPFAADDLFKQETIRFTQQGGKRFRPALSLIVARQAGQADAFPHIALETFHKFLLAHDDVIDQDDMRYGASTIHARMRQLYNRDRHFGNALAIIAGDLTLAVTTKIILRARLPAKTKLALQQLIVQALEEVAVGWYDQFLMDYEPLDSPKLSFERIETSLMWVTGRYSLKLPILFGYGVAGKVAPDGIEALADTLGALFQTGDDVIGLFGNPEATGKSNFGDIAQGKKTIPMWFAYQNATVSQKKVLERLVGKTDITLPEVAEVRNIIKTSGALERTQVCMQNYRKKSLQQLESIDMPPELKDFFRGFVYHLETRDR